MDEFIILVIAGWAIEGTKVLIIILHRRIARKRKLVSHKKARQARTSHRPDILPQKLNAA